MSVESNLPRYALLDKLELGYWHRKFGRNNGKTPQIFSADPLEIKLPQLKISGDGSRSISSYTTLLVFQDFDRAIRQTKLWSRVEVISKDIYEGDSDGKKEF